MAKELDHINPTLLEEDDRITLYLKGKMSSHEEQAFMHELENNPELKARAIAVARLVKGMKETGRSQDNDVINAMLATDENEIREITKSITKGKAKVVPMRTMAKWISMAASILLCGLVLAIIITALRLVLERSMVHYSALHNWQEEREKLQRLMLI